MIHTVRVPPGRIQGSERAQAWLHIRVEMSGLFKPLSPRIAINGRRSASAAGWYGVRGAGRGREPATLPSFISPRFQWIDQTEKRTLSEIALSARTSVYNLLRAETEWRI